MLSRFDRLVRKRPARALGGGRPGTGAALWGAKAHPRLLTPPPPAGRLHPHFSAKTTSPAAASSVRGGPEAPRRPLEAGARGAHRREGGQARRGRRSLPSRPGLRGEPGQAPLLREPAGPAPSLPKRSDGPAEDGTALVSRLQRRPGARPARGGRAPLAPRREATHGFGLRGSLRLTPHQASPPPQTPQKPDPGPSHGVSRGGREGAPLAPRAPAAQGRRRPR